MSDLITKTILKFPPNERLELGMDRFLHETSQCRDECVFCELDILLEKANETCGGEHE